ncbi:MAG TPA: MmcQ/YjbR family DNA-binding protein [Edaphobacter sp.]|nr:MmcQ/YjbR family DNA-binding protein [Edaphobacter sp.]
MDVEQIRTFVLGLPHVAETMQWGAKLVFWVGDKSIGGKMFAVVNLEEDGRSVISFCAGQERFAELLEREGILPAPYLARAYWVAVERWNVLSAVGWQEELTAAHSIVASRLSKKTLGVLAMPVRERKRIITERKGAQPVTKRKRSSGYQKL